ncbi:scavenger mRNA-decapping enzyme DcpS [Thraustotheca clavata]|uniref:m7GpppX diphosphatase n=1 Tax=Thraustotheca clavata TaxID=74557 RepID=A0A1W0A8Y3_9STRA|nr:scavenger mRNA-decapping enzyme DcpS [Thraustotheca clavata]
MHFMIDRDVGMLCTVFAVGLSVGYLANILLPKMLQKKSSIDLSKFQLEKITKVFDNEMCVVGHFPNRPNDRALLVLRKQKFAAGDTCRILSNLTLRQIHENDVYSNHIGVFSSDNDALHVTMIYPATAAHIAKHTEQTFHFVVETQEVYEKVTLPYIQSIPEDKIQWVYNILDGTQEAEKIILQDKDPSNGFLLLPDTKWARSSHIESLYCLALVQDKKIRSLRDLTGKHLGLLRNVRDKCLELIATKYGVPATSIRVFVHYQPSYYHFHIHFAHIKVPFGIFVGKAILLEDIIYNLSQDDDHYKKATISFVVGEQQHAELYKSVLA